MCQRPEGEWTLNLSTVATWCIFKKGLQKPRAAGISSAFNWHLCLEAFCNLSSLARALKKSVENRLRVGGTGFPSPSP